MPVGAEEADLRAEVDSLYARLATLEARLRKSTKSGRAPGAQVEVLFITIGDLEAAFELEAVREVVPAALLAPLPEAPSWVMGTLNLRGTSIPVVHMGARMNHAEPILGVDDLIVVVSTELGAAGFAVDQVGTIVSVKLDDSASLLETRHAAYVVGSFSQDNKARLLLGVQELLRHSDLAQFIPVGVRSA